MLIQKAFSRLGGELTNVEKTALQTVTKILIRAQTYRALQLDCVGVISCLCEPLVLAAHKLRRRITLRNKVQVVVVTELRRSSS